MIVAGIGIDQHDLVAELAQRLARLRAGIVEFARLADDDRAGTDDQDLLDVRTFWHWVFSCIESSPDALADAASIEVTGHPTDSRD